MTKTDDEKSRKKLSLNRNTRRITLLTLFSVLIFVSKTFLPSPIDKMLIVIQALFLALSSLMSRPLGATIVAALGAALTVLIRPSLAHLTIIFALTYGLLTDAFTYILRVKSTEGDVKVNRLVATMTISTTITGLASYYTTVHILAVLPRNPILEITILVTGVISGMVGGYLAVLIWKRAIRHIIDVRP